MKIFNDFAEGSKIFPAKIIYCLPQSSLIADMCGWQKAGKKMSAKQFPKIAQNIKVSCSNVEV